MLTMTAPGRARWVGVVTRFVAGQLSLQAVNAFTGLLVLRWLTVSEYAEYSVAIAFQTSLGMLVDLGFAGSVVALVGERGSDAAVVGGYIRSVQHVRTRTLALAAVAAAVAFPVVTRTQPWSAARKTLLLLTILLAVAFQRWSVYSAPLRLHGRLNAFYLPQIATGVVRLALCFVLARLGLLSGWLATAVAAFSILANGLSFRHYARPLIEEPRRADPATNAEMLRYIAPLTPGIIYTAIQGQVTIAVITIFGRTTSIAEVAALGRLGQLFLLLNAFNAILLEPFVARLPSHGLRSRYLQALSAVIAVAGITSLLSFLAPGPLVSLLGAKYAHLRPEIGWLVTASCMNFVAGAAWTMNSARRWLSWRYTGAYIATMVCAQVLAARSLDLGTTHSVVLFSLYAAIASLIVHCAAGLLGLLRTTLPRDGVPLASSDQQISPSPARAAGGMA